MGNDLFIDWNSEKKRTVTMEGSRMSDITVQIKIDVWLAGILKFSVITLRFFHALYTAKRMKTKLYGKKGHCHSGLRNKFCDSWNCKRLHLTLYCWFVICFFVQPFLHFLYTLPCILYHGIESSDEHRREKLKFCWSTRVWIISFFWIYKFLFAIYVRLI